jgi:hypothetical protein
MIRLDATTRSLEAALGGAVSTNQLPVTASYSDKTSSAYTGATQLANTNDATAVTIVAAPGASTVRDVDYISIRNSDTASATVTVRYNDNTTLYTIITATLAVGDQLVYTHGNGWETLDSSGNKKTSSPNYQPFDLTLSSLSALGTSADKFAYTTGLDTWAEADITAAARSLLDDATAADMRTTLEVFEPITATDTLTWHEAAQQSVSATSYATVFDLAGAVHLIGGAIMSGAPGMRITIDGTVVMNRTLGVSGDDIVGDGFGVVFVPNCRSVSSLKLEAYNASGSARDFGWRVVTR